MELQWPLILFTSFIAWCAGLFGTQCLFVLLGKGEKTQFAAWITSAVLLVVGGVAVFLHLEHWERIFNGFGHITSGITQELIAIVALAIIAIIFVVMLKRSGKVAKWVAVLGLVCCVALVVVMGHSYMMAALPAWNSALQVVSLLGASCLLGPATFAFLASMVGDDGDFSLSVLVGAVANLVASVAYLLVMSGSGSSFANMGYYFDPTRATFGMTDIASFSPFASMAMPYTVIVILASAIALVAALFGKKQGMKLWGLVAVVCGILAAVLLRVVFYLAGGHVFTLF